MSKYGNRRSQCGKPEFLARSDHPTALSLLVLALVSMGLRRCILGKANWTNVTQPHKSKRETRYEIDEYQITPKGRMNNLTIMNRDNERLTQVKSKSPPPLQCRCITSITAVLRQLLSASVSFCQSLASSKPSVIGTGVEIDKSPPMPLQRPPKSRKS